MVDVNIIRWGILGTGYAARLFAMGLKYLPDAQLLAIGSRNKESAKEFASTFNVHRQYSSYEKLVEDRDIDVVYIATPPSLHRNHCLLCLDAGKAILCEKPFTLNASQAIDVVTRAREKRLFCMEAMWMRFLPALQKLPSIVEKENIGELCALFANFGVPTPYDLSNRPYNPELGGGALLDLGVYLISLASLLFGKPEHVTSQSIIAHGGIDEQTTVVLSYQTGKIATLYASLKTAPSNEAIILGTEGEIRIHAPFYRPHRISIKRFSGHKARAMPGPGKFPFIKQKLPFLQDQYYRLERYLPSYIKEKTHTVVLPFKGNGYNYEAEEVMCCLRNGKIESSIMSLDETIEIMRVMDIVRKSSFVV